MNSIDWKLPQDDEKDVFVNGKQLEWSHLHDHKESKTRIQNDLCLILLHKLLLIVFSFELESTNQLIHFMQQICQAT